MPRSWRRSTVRSPFQWPDRRSRSMWRWPPPSSASKPRANARLAPDDCRMNIDDAVARLDAARAEALAAIGGAESVDDLDALEREYLKGRGSTVSQVQEAIKTFAADDRPRAGQAVGAYRSAVGDALAA